MGESRIRIVLLEPDDKRRGVLEGRLRAQSFQVESFGSPSEAANWALGNPPAALVADLWSSGVSGVQLCRLLRSEQATEHVQVILRAEGNSPKFHFWAEQAGAAAYVPKGRIGDLVRAVHRATNNAPSGEDFFTHLGQLDVRDRIAMHLDHALCESVIASSVRALGTCESLPRLFDLFSQFFCRIGSYHWLALHVASGDRLAVHCIPGGSASSVANAKKRIGCEGKDLILIEDEDALEPDKGIPPLLAPIVFGTQVLGTLAIQPVDGEENLAETLRLVAQEIGGPLRIVSLIEESRRLAHFDLLTGIMNRRAFVSELQTKISDAERLSECLCLLLLDVDHFKAVNDNYGHATGDLVLAKMGKLMKQLTPENALVARWGGEEFVVGLPAMKLSAAAETAEQLRRSIEAHCIETTEGHSIPISVSIGAAQWTAGESLDSLVERADRAMYAAKVGGRNRVELSAQPKPLPLQ